jgi:glycosyltransferase involved in cell wall biosynthesis
MAVLVETDPKPKLLLTVWRRTWIRPDLERMLRERYDVRVRAARRDRGAGFISKRELVRGEMSFFLRLLASPSLYGRDCRVVCIGGHYGTLLFAAVLRAFGLRRPTYLLNFYLHELGQHPLVKRVLDMLLTGDVHVLAQTRGDAEYFRQFLPPDNVAVLPYSQEDPFVDVGIPPSENGGYVFSGGWTNRDYDFLFRCAKQLPAMPFVVVASKQSAISEEPPSNVSLLIELESAEFHRLMARSRFVVIPLREDVGSSGQMVLLAAMAAGKAAIVARVGAVADYIEDGVTGVFYDLGSEASLVSALASLYADDRRVRELGLAARETYLKRFKPERFNGAVLEHISASPPAPDNRASRSRWTSGSF